MILIIKKTEETLTLKKKYILQNCYQKYILLHRPENVKFFKYIEACMNMKKLTINKDLTLHTQI